MKFIRWCGPNRNDGRFCLLPVSLISSESLRFLHRDLSRIHSRIFCLFTKFFFWWKKEETKIIYQSKWSGTRPERTRTPWIVERNVSRKPFVFANKIPAKSCIELDRFSESFLCRCRFIFFFVLCLSSSNFSRWQSNVECESRCKTRFRSFFYILFCFVSFLFDLEKKRKKKKQYFGMHLRIHRMKRKRTIADFWSLKNMKKNHTNHVCKYIVHTHTRVCVRATHVTA